MSRARKYRLFALLALALLYPVAWVAPLLRAGLLPFFGMAEISVLSGLRSLNETDPFLAGIVAVFALILPYVKLLGLLWAELAPMSRLAHGLLSLAGRLAMADVFLIAIYVTIAKGMGVGRVETGWGLYLFTLCVLTSLGLGLLPRRRRP